MAEMRFVPGHKAAPEGRLRRLLVSLLGGCGLWPQLPARVQGALCDCPIDRGEGAEEEVEQWEWPPVCRDRDGRPLDCGDAGPLGGGEGPVFYEALPADRPTPDMDRQHDLDTADSAVPPAKVGPRASRAARPCRGPGRDASPAAGGGAAASPCGLAADAPESMSDLLASCRAMAAASEAMADATAGFADTLATALGGGHQRRLVAWFERPRPPITVLCGSTRFGEAFQAANLRLTLAGHIVLSVGCDTKPDGDLLGAGAESARVKAELDELHKRKIDLADRVLVLNVGGYIGASTASEIAYAKRRGKPIDYLEAAHAPA